MNIAFDPWIPVVTTMGERKLVSLCSVLAEGEQYADLAVRPHERVSLMRLFLCVAHAALNGPRDYDEWCATPERLAEVARNYLTEWKTSFDLFHPTKPWLQVPALTKSADGSKATTDVRDWTPVSKLNFSLATGNN
ncbi:MAG: type I-E CRISPR-associated protein Cse1/CasA, partial [Desulfobulbaceae bacterium]|nr:type I-E CRISPR-associated protein Cse1/CasA [Desulfobulbaceae bacterium]